MLEGYGLHTLIWDSADERLGDFLVASPQTRRDAGSSSTCAREAQRPT